MKGKRITESLPNCSGRCVEQIEQSRGNCQSNDGSAHAFVSIDIAGPLGALDIATLNLSFHFVYAPKNESLC